MDRNGLASVGLALVLAAAPAGAQSNDEIQTGMQYNFLAPGARSLGLGGAFVGLADDATAAYTNPAGLTQLTEPEVSLEGRTWTYSSLFVERGHMLGEASGIGLDAVDGLQQGRMDDEAAGLSFLSYVHVGRRWALSLYRHQLACFEASLRSEGIFLGPGNFRISPLRSHLELDIVGFGIAGAWEVSDALSIGLGAASYSFDLAALTERVAVEGAIGDPEIDALPGHIYGPAVFSADNILNTQVQQGEDQDLAINVGFLWRVSDRLRVGGVYREGAEFDFAGTFIGGPMSTTPGQIDLSVGGPGVFHVPNILGLGAAFRISDTAVVTLDWDHVDYTEVNDDLLNMIRVGRSDPENYVVDDGNEIHAGFEYVFLGLRRSVALRLGAWHDPDHKIHYTGERPIAQARFQPGADEVHLSGGFGLVVGRAQFDLAGDVSDGVTTLSFSTVVGF